MEKRKTTTSAQVRNRWNSAHYDRINVTIPKGYKDRFNKYCEDTNTTMNSVLSAVVKFAVDAYRAKRGK